MTTELHATQVNLSGLMDVLGRHLYSTPLVAVRELIQNAHDSCRRRHMEDRSPFEPEINVFTDPARGLVVIEDNGSGMTRDEITQYIATVGSGYTRLLQEKEADGTFIGQFGLGFLTAYVVARRVELWTTSYQEPDQGWHFVSLNPERYHLNDSKPREVGTRLVLHLLDEFLQLSEPSIMAKVLGYYCGLLPIPIYLNGDREKPINYFSPPWQMDVKTLSPVKFKKICTDFAEYFQTSFKPLCTIPVYPDEENDAAGLIWIHDGWAYGSSDNRNAFVFIKGMLVSQDERDMLPPWAGFAGGVFECNSLLPTASREDIQKDETYDRIRHYISETLIQGISEIAKTDVILWRLILRRHNEALLGAALCDDRLFNALADAVKVPTSEGDMTLPAVLGQSGDAIYISTGEKGGYEDVIFRAQRKPVVAGYRYATLPFCAEYGSKFGVRVVHLGTQEGDHALFTEEQVSPDVRKDLEHLLCEDEGHELIPARFSPDYLPLVLLPDREFLLKQRIESDEAERRITQAVLQMARIFTTTIENRTPSRLYVNLDSPVIQRMLEMENPARRHLAALLRSFTHLISRQVSEFKTDISAEFKAYAEALIRLTDKTEA
jgi:molecular chaperone HtpG